MDIETFQKYIEIYESKIKIRILNLLQVYQELSLTDLSAKMGKSKSTISKHIKEMQEIVIEGESIIKVREEQHRGSIMQKFFSMSNTPLFFGKTYDDIINFTSEEMYKYLHINEYIINLRFFSLLKEINDQTIEYISEFYNTLVSDELDDDFKENVYKYNTCIPRISYYTKEEYEEYREKFIEFDEDFLKEIQERRNKDPKSVLIPREYLVSHTLLPIKRILDKKFN